MSCARRVCDTDPVTNIQEYRRVRQRAPRGVHVLGWIAYPVLGVLAAVAADALQRALAWRGPAQLRNALEFWLPTIVPARASYAVAPWPDLTWLALLLTLGLALAAFSIFVHAATKARPWWTRALILWVLFVVTGVGVVGIAQIGEWLLGVQTFGGLGGSHIRGFTVPALLEAARWGVLWGWIPAIATALVAAPRPDGVWRRRTYGIAAACLVAGAVAGVALASVTYGAAESTRTEVAQEPAEPTPGPTDVPAPVAETVAPGFEGRCAAEDLEVEIAGTDAATGARYLAFSAENVGSEPCALHGAPDLAFAGEDGNAIRPVITVQDVTAMREAIPDSPVTIAPGETVRAELEWRAPTGRPEALTFYIAPWAGAPRAVDVESADIIDGLEMTLTPWHTPTPQRGDF